MGVCENHSILEKIWGVRCRGEGGGGRGGGTVGNFHTILIKHASIRQVARIHSYCRARKEAVTHTFTVRAVLCALHARKVNCTGVCGNVFVGGGGSQVVRVGPTSCYDVGKPLGPP